MIVRCDYTDRIGSAIMRMIPVWMIHLFHVEVLIYLIASLLVPEPSKSHIYIYALTI